MPRHSEARKEAVLSKLLPPHNLSISEVAESEGIRKGTLYSWRQKAKQRGEPVPGKKPSSSQQWSAEAKLATVVVTASMSESEMSEYCRKKGLYVEQIKQWKQACLTGFSTVEQQDKTARQQEKYAKKEIDLLKRELRYKDKALAETTAILVMRKKLNALFGNDDEEI